MVGACDDGGEPSYRNGTGGGRWRNWLSKAVEGFEGAQCTAVGGTLGGVDSGGTGDLTGRRATEAAKADDAVQHFDK